MQLNDLLKDIYQDEEIPVQLLVKYGLESVLDTIVQKVTNILQTLPVPNGRIVSLAPMAAVLINSSLREVPTGNDKDKLVYLAAEVSNHLFRKLIESSEQPVAAIRDIRKSLEDACELNKYNLDDLLEKIRFNEIETQYSKSIAISLPFFNKKKKGIYWYDWIGKRNLLNKLSHKLQRQGYIFSVREFKKLFKQHGDPELRVRFKIGCAPFMIALFEELKIAEFIIPKGSRPNAYFHALHTYGVDFAGEKWMKSEPKSTKTIAKRNKENWIKIENSAKAIVLELQRAVASKLPLPNSGQNSHPL